MLNPNDMNKAHENIDREYIGTVENHDDPMKIGRLQVRVPELYGDIPKEHLPWANPSSGFGGGKGFGFFMIPTPGSKVRVRLFRGHPWTPEWIGTHWFEKEPPTESQISPPHNYLIKSPKGHLIDLHDDKPYVRIRDMHGNFVILNTEKDDLEIKVGNDSHQETGRDYDETVGRSKHTRTSQYLDEKVGTNRRTKAQASISFDAGTDVRIRGGASVYIEGGGAVNVKGATVYIEADAHVNVLGGVNVNIEGDGAVNVLALANLSLEAAADINILAGGAVNIDGSAVNIQSGLALPAGSASGADPANPKQPD